MRIEKYSTNLKVVREPDATVHRSEFRHVTDASKYVKKDAICIIFSGVIRSIQKINRHSQNFLSLIFRAIM